MIRAPFFLSALIALFLVFHPARSFATIRVPLVAKYLGMCSDLFEDWTHAEVIRAFYIVPDRHAFFASMSPEAQRRILASLDRDLQEHLLSSTYSFAAYWAPQVIPHLESRAWSNRKTAQFVAIILMRLLEDFENPESIKGAAQILSSSKWSLIPRGISEELRDFIQTLLPTYLAMTCLESPQTMHVALAAFWTGMSRSPFGTPEVAHSWRLLEQMRSQPGLSQEAQEAVDSALHELSYQAHYTGPVLAR